MEPLSIGRALREAIAAEHAAAWNYTRLAACTTDPQAVRLFLAMIPIERQRAHEIAALGRRYLDGATLDPGDRSYEFIKVAPGWTDVSNITFDESLRIVLETHQRAAQYYAGLATLFEEEEARVIREIARAEHRLAGMVERTIEQRMLRDSVVPPKMVAA